MLHFHWKWEPREISKSLGDRVVFPWVLLLVYPYRTLLLLFRIVRNFSSEFDSCIDLQSNPELKSFLERNKANPDSSTLARHLVPNYNPDDEHRLRIRQAIFDELGAQQQTPSADRGRTWWCYVKLPFPREAFLSCFGEGKFNFAAHNVNGTGCQNVNFRAARRELDPVLGTGWAFRSLKYPLCVKLTQALILESSGGTRIESTSTTVVVLAARGKKLTSMTGPQYVPHSR